MSVYSTEEKVKIVSNYIRGLSSREVRDHFAAEFPDRPIPNQSTVIRLHNQFITHGCLNFEHHKNKKKGNRVVIEDLKQNVCLAVEEEPTSSVSKLSHQFQVSRSSCYRALKHEKYKSYKIHNVQHLLERDYFPRMEFCEYWMDRINENPHVQNLLFFSDEKTFFLNGTVNNQNTRFWSRENPYIFQEAHTQWPQKLNVYAGILGNNIIGPFVIEGSLNGAKYLELLNNRILPAIRRNAVNGRVIFQHDGAPPHNSRHITQFLNLNFQEWIGRFGELKWPARSPDLSPMDFFYWGYLATKVYDNNKDRPQNLEELENRITESSNEINVRQLQNVKRNFRDRLAYCLAANGQQFEHLI